MVREGEALTVLAYGTMVHVALAAVEENKIDAEVIDLRTIVPLDREAVLKSVRKTGRLLVADEDYLSFGLSGEVAAVVAERLDRINLRAPVRRLAVPDVPIPYSRPLEMAVIPQVSHIVTAAQDLMKARTATAVAV